MTSIQDRALALSVFLLFLAPSSFAQQEAPPSITIPLAFDSGSVENQTGAPATVISIPISVAQAPWMRLKFSEVVLAGDPEQGTGSMLRVTSLLDGAEQRMNARHVAEWQESSAYFNGDTLLVEVIAQPGSGENRLVFESVTVGEDWVFEKSQCGSTDDRVLSTDVRAARILPVGCTGWLINDACGCFLTAGHCSFAASVMQFNVPLSTSSGQLVNPPPEDQYSVDATSVQSNGGLGVGNDYAYLGCFANSNTGLTPAQAQGSTFVIVNPPAYQNGQTIRITGYGTDSTPSQNNQVQQTNTGPRVSASGTTVSYQTDTEGGNSGSPVIFESTGQAIGIHTHGGCSTTAGNSGTSIAHSGLQAFLASPKGVCVKATPVANFSGAPTSGQGPLSVAFTDTSIGTPTAWAWTFGDGGTSTAKDPTHVYTAAGTFTVSLLASNAQGSDSETKASYISVLAPPTASATFRNGSGVNPSIFTSTSLPIIGTIWNSTVDAGAVGGTGLVLVLGFSGSLTGVPTGFGELLVDVGAQFTLLAFGIPFGGIASVSYPVPNDANLAGLAVFTQAYVDGVTGGSGQLTNAYDLIVGF